MVDMHTHTTYSPDASMTIMEAAAQADILGITHMAITDHCDYPPDLNNTDWIVTDIPGYIRDITAAQHAYTHLNIIRGMEIGHVDYAKDRIEDLLDALQPDFIIGSSHYIHGVDPYFRTYYDNKTKQEAYIEYLDYIAESILEMDERICVVGHIGYVTRYGPYHDRSMHYADFPEAIDRLLQNVIHRGMGIEINTSGYNTLGVPMPTFSLVERYRQLGGEILTIGSDAHSVDRLGQHYHRAVDMAKSAGFKYQAIFKDLQPTFIEL